MGIDHSNMKSYCETISPPSSLLTKDKELSSLITKNLDLKRSKRKRQTIREEKFNFATHGAGAILSLFGLYLIIDKSMDIGTLWNLVCCTVYGSTLVILYTASSMYHYTRNRPLKKILRKIDHLSIYLLIAGSYTPFTLINMRNDWGWHMFYAIWTMTLAGFILKIFYFGRFEKLSITLYLTMGWMVILAIQPLFANIAIAGFLWIVFGGVIYSFGVFFFVLDKKPYYHTIWHGFVMGGSFCHFIAIYYYVLPISK